jgi:hypothetical protein
MTNIQSIDDKNIKLHKHNPDKPSQDSAKNESDPRSSLAALQQQVGNRAVQRLLVQRSGDGSFELDDETANRINRQRASGQSLDSSVQTKMGDATGQDFSGVRVHTGPESHALNESLNAKAFTTGQDIFFREGAYDPGSTGGQELLAHELTHVVQQSSGRVGGGGGAMAVNAPGDAFEQEADSVAKSVMSSGSTPEVQRETSDEDEIQTQSLQRQEMREEDKSLLQKQGMDENEEEEINE